MSDDVLNRFEDLTPRQRLDCLRDIALKRLERTGWPKGKPFLTAFLKAATGLKPPGEKSPKEPARKPASKKKRVVKCRKQAKK